MDDFNEKAAVKDIDDKQNIALLRKIMTMFIVEERASVPLIQRKFGMGYVRSCRLLDYFTDLGLVSVGDNKNPGKALISPEELDKVLPFADGDVIDI